MAKSIFEHVADGLELRTDLAKLEARDTVRLALERAGLDVGSIGTSQMRAVLTIASRGADGSRCGAFRERV
ncbi:MAG: hypothetical protein JRH16_03845 [Deltaproteobacteria bacterium]|nr:hypothetical protein [Deltaproteobacteria bacterium]MBW2361084.1 hypothetical protein [Deltaproteobacteria bacterium]